MLYMNVVKDREGRHKILLRAKAMNCNLLSTLSRRVCLRDDQSKARTDQKSDERRRKCLIQNQANLNHFIL